MKTSSQQPWIVAILVLGLGECILLTLMFLADSPPDATGYAHPTIPGMAVGGDSSRFFPIANLAFVFQLLVLTQAHCLAALGVNPNRRTPTFIAALGACLACAVFVWWQIFSSYEAFLETGDPNFVFGFPEASAWQVYAIWGSGLSLVALYSIGFKHYVWNEEDESKFKALISANPKSGEQ